MSQALQLLERAFQLARLEREALRTRNYDQAVKLSEQRQALMEAARDRLEASEHAAYRERLLQLADMQRELTALAREAHQSVLTSLQGTRKQKMRLRGYKQVVALSLQ